MWRVLPSLSRDRGAKVPSMRVFIFSVVVLVLGWQVVTSTLVAYLVDRHPQTALWISPGHAGVLIAQAQRKLEVDLGGGVVAPASSLTASDVNPSPVGGMAAPAAAGEPSSAPPLNGLERWARLADAARRPTPVDAEVAAAPAEADGKLGGGLDARPVAITPEGEQSAQQIRAWVTAALAKDPSAAQGYRILGQVASLLGDDVEAKAMMEIAAARSLREHIAHFWLMRHAIDGRDYAVAANHAETILRTNPRLHAIVTPSLVEMAASEKGSDAVWDLMARNLPARHQVFSGFVSSVGDARTPLSLLLHLKTTPHPPQPNEIKFYLNFLITNKLYELAYNTLLQFLPADQLSATGHLFNGRFQFPLAGYAFDWTISARAGVIAEILAAPEGKSGNALQVEFRTGQIDFPGVSQTVMLRPGTYQFKGQYRGTLVGRRGLKWHVTCVEKPSVRIGESQMFLGIAPAWQAFSFPLTVGEEGCLAQMVRLELDARSASERLVTGSMWFTDLEITNGAGEPTAPQ